MSHLFIPEGSAGGFQSFETSAAALAGSKRLRVGSGVIRILEHDPAVLASRLLTLQELFDNRFILGIGTGRPSSNPRLTIESMLDRLNSTRECFQRFAEASPGLKMPETYVATLRKGIAKMARGHSEGILLNFCPPEYARSLVRSLGNAADGPRTISCYLKLFFSRDLNRAKRMLVQELANYDRNPDYHNMFEEAGIARKIASASSSLVSETEVQLDEKLLEVSLANPTGKQLGDYVAKFRDAGVNLPCLYPYFEGGEEEAFRLSKVRELAHLRVKN